MRGSQTVESALNYVRSRWAPGRWLERRLSPRKRVTVTGWIVTDGRGPPSVCVLWDVSRTGARLSLMEPEKLPEKFLLLFSRNGFPGIGCRVVWRSGMQVGIEYLTTSAESDALARG
jgi:hypothetical protein